jgi:carboxylesterase type B
LNLNIICPAGLTPDSKVPVMLWVHGYVSIPF